MSTVLGSRFADAVRLVSELHASQVRKGTEIPYVSHLLGVAAIVLEHGGTEDEAIAGLLHDAVEDQGGAATRDLIADQFGEAVALIVDGCTDDSPAPGEAKKPWKVRKEAYIAHAAVERNPSVILVSAADKIYNANAIKRDLDSIGEEVWHRFNAPREEILWYYASLVEAFGSAEEVINASPETVDHRITSVLNTLESTVLELHLMAEVSELEEGMYDDEE